MKLKLLLLTLVISGFVKAQIPTNGLVGSWLFTGNALDSTGNNNGTVFGATLTTDRFGSNNGAYNFNGLNNYISIPADSFLLDTYTYSIWAKISSIPVFGTYPIATSIGSGASGGDQNIDILNLGGVNLGWSGGGYNQGGSPATSSTATGILPAINTWHHITVTRDFNFLKLYVDCQLIDSSSTGGQAALYGSGMKYFYVGARSGLLNVNYYFDGVIDDIHIYNRVLASNEIVGLCNSTCIGSNFLDSVSVSICQGDSALLAGVFQTTSGIYTDSLQTVLGCDSLVITTLTINPIFLLNQTETICQGDSVLLQGGFQNAAGIYVDSLQTSFGCDSVIITNLSINPIFNSIQNQVICQGDSFLFGNVFYNSSGIYIDSLQTVSGCDSLLTLNLTVNPSFQINRSQTICQGDSALLAGVFQTASGIYTDSLQTVLGCDSLVITALSVGSAFFDSVTISICQGNSVFLGGLFQTIAGVYVDSLFTVSGCDSVVASTLIVNPIPVIVASNDTTINACNSAQLNVVGGGTYLWTPSTDLSCITCSTPVASPSSSITYTVTETTSGCSSSDIVNITVDGESILIIPNVFTPNFDGSNDGFNFVGGCIIAAHKRIYNRWGELLFESNQIEEVWNGRTTAGKDVPEGTYFYIFIVDMLDSGNEVQRIFKGTVSLLR